MVITGYRIKSTDLKDIMMELDTVKRKIKDMFCKEYHKLLGEEIAFLADNISLNVINRSPKTSIYDDAVKNLDFKMDMARKTSAETKFNFYIYAHIMTLEEYTYLRVICPNEVFLKAFKTLEDYSVDEIEYQDNGNKKTDTWNTLHKLYANSEPMIINLSQPIKPEKEKITYPAKKDRAETIARHTIMNHLLNTISGGQQIPPVLLMPYMDMAIEMLDRADVKHQYNAKVTSLMQILTDLEDNDSFVYQVTE